MPANVTATLRKALSQLEAERSRIDHQLGLIHAVLGQAGSTQRTGRRRMSPAERAAVSRRMKAYWAKRRAATKKPKKAATRSARRSAVKAK
jgi:hypothetical protein